MAAAPSPEPWLADPLFQGLAHDSRLGRRIFPPYASSNELTGLIF
jgi:hypothetical protein